MAEKSSKAEKSWIASHLETIVAFVFCVSALYIIVRPTIGDAHQRHTAITEAEHLLSAIAIYQTETGNALPPTFNGSETIPGLPLLQPQESFDWVSSYTFNTLFSGRSTTDFANSKKLWILHANAPDSNGKYLVAFANSKIEFVGPKELIDIVHQAPVSKPAPTILRF